MYKALNTVAGTHQKLNLSQQMYMSNGSFGCLQDASFFLLLEKLRPLAAVLPTSDTYYSSRAPFLGELDHLLALELAT